MTSTLGFNFRLIISTLKAYLLLVERDEGNVITIHRTYSTLFDLRGQLLKKLKGEKVTQLASLPGNGAFTKFISNIILVLHNLSGSFLKLFILRELNQGIRNANRHNS